MWKCAVFILCIFALFVHGNEEWRLVNLDQGPVRGRIHSEGGLYIFYNIPYATAPTGRDRFKAPLPPPVWMSTFDAVNRGIACPQPSPLPNRQENCLIANVFVPDTEATNLPVIVTIHGGAYQYGFGLGEQFKDLVRSKKVIAVSFNYRLGAHGFLCLGTEAAPGNAGLKDQIALLRWVKANIARFGGNPEDVTIAGCSAGSGSVDVLTLSSITDGLFNKAILESGNSIGAVGLQIDPIANAKEYAKVLNFDNVNDIKSLEEFYTTATYQQLLSRADVITSREDVSILFGPCVEQDIGQERVIMDTPLNVLKNKNYTKVPLLYGFTNLEGAMRLPQFNAWRDRMNEKFSEFLPGELHFESEDVKEEVAQKIKKFYFGDAPVSTDSILSYIKYFTDVLFAYPMLRSLSTRVEALGDTVYLFEYSFVDEQTIPFPNTNVRGAQHCEQLMAVLDQDVSQRTEEYKRMKQIMRDYWLNFILNGSPSSNISELPTWTPASEARAPHMALGPVIELKKKPEDILGDRAAFWDSIYEEHYRGPLVPAPDTDGGATPLMVSNVMFVSLLLTWYLR